MDWVHKYAPTRFVDCAPTFDYVALLHHLSGDRSQSFLLDGPTGCGKTTVARLIARELGCAHSIECNMADDNKIDEVRALLGDMAQPSLLTDQTVYILDEPQRIKKDVQQLLLKILEDAPPFTVIILCTTEPQHLIEPIHARCHRVSVHSLDERESKRLIGRIAKAEDITFAPDDDTQDPRSGHVLTVGTGHAILDASRGRPRSLIRNLQLAYEGLPLLDADIGEPGADVMRLFDRLVRGTWPQVVTELKQVSDYEGTRQVLAHLFRGCLERDDVILGALLGDMVGLIVDPDGRNTLTWKCYQVFRHREERVHGRP